MLAQQRIANRRRQPLRLDGGSDVDQIQETLRNKFFKHFSFVDKTPEEILLQTITLTTILLVGAALFDHTPLPLIPAGILVFGWRAYHLRRAGH
jgi:hypothetical protein